MEMTRWKFYWRKMMGKWVGQRRRRRHQLHWTTSLHFYVSQHHRPSWRHHVRSVSSTHAVTWGKLLRGQISSYFCGKTEMHCKAFPPCLLSTHLATDFPEENLNPLAVIDVSIINSSDCSTESTPSFGKNTQNMLGVTMCQVTSEYFLWMISMLTSLCNAHALRSPVLQVRTLRLKKWQAACPHYTLGSNTAGTWIQTPLTPEKKPVAVTHLAMGRWLRAKPHTLTPPAFCLWQGMILKGWKRLDAQRFCLCVPRMRKQTIMSFLCHSFF